MATQVYTELLQLRLTPELRREVAALAAEEQRPVSVMARLLIERAVRVAKDATERAAEKRALMAAVKGYGSPKRRKGR